MSDLMAKAKEVQEAAAEAALAENDSVPHQGPNPPDSDIWPDEPMDHSAIARIPAAFAYIGELDYSGLDDKEAAMNAGASDLELAQGSFSNLTDLFTEDKFLGNTIADFCTFLGVVADAAEDQGQLAKALANGVATQRTILDSAEHDAMEIAKATITACEGIKAEHEAVDVPMTFMCLALGAEIVATSVLGGLPFALLNCLATVAGEAYTAGGKTVSGDDVDGLGGEDLDTVLNGDKGMYALLEKRQEHLDESERKLASVVREDHHRLDEKMGSYNPRAGDLVKGRGKFRATGAVKADLEKLYKYATGHGSGGAKDTIPQLAKDLSGATFDFYRAAIPDEAMGKAAEPWESLLDRLMRLTGKASTNLYDGGTVLGKAAQDFARQDGLNAEWIEEIGKEFMDRDNPMSPPTDTVSESRDSYTIEEGPYKGKQIPN